MAWHYSSPVEPHSSNSRSQLAGDTPQQVRPGLTKLQPLLHPDGRTPPPETRIPTSAIACTSHLTNGKCAWCRLVAPSGAPLPVGPRIPALTFRRALTPPIVRSVAAVLYASHPKIQEAYALIERILARLYHIRSERGTQTGDANGSVQG